MITYVDTDIFIYTHSIFTLLWKYLTMKERTLRKTTYSWYRVWSLLSSAESSLSQESAQSLLYTGQIARNDFPLLAQIETFSFQQAVQYCGSLDFQDFLRNVGKLFLAKPQQGQQLPPGAAGVPGRRSPGGSPGLGSLRRAASGDSSGRAGVALLLLHR